MGREICIEFYENKTMGAGISNDRNQNCAVKKMADTTDYHEGRRAHFTYIWAIENSSSLELLTPLYSPDISVESLEMTRWKLWLNILGANIRLNLQRLKENYGPEEIEIDYEISFLGIDGLPLLKRASANIYRRARSSTFPEFAETDEVFRRRRAEFLPGDVLTVRCRMWKKGPKTPKPELFLISTRFAKYRHRFFWGIHDFSSLQLGYKTTRLLRSTSKDFDDLNLNLSFREYESKVYICIDIGGRELLSNEGIKGDIAILDDQGAVVHSGKMWKIAPNWCKYLPYTDLCKFERQKLLSGKNTLLHNDVIILRCEFEIYRGPL